MTAAGANDVDAPTDNGIEVEGLVKDFKGGVRAVDGIDLRVAPGDLAAQRTAQRGEGRLGDEAKLSDVGEPASPSPARSRSSALPAIAFSCRTAVSLRTAP